MSSILKLSLEEKNWIDNIVAISCKDKNTVKDVLKALLKAITLEMFSENYNVCIPYLCNLQIEYSDKITENGLKTDVRLIAEPNEALIQEIEKIIEGEMPPTHLSHYQQLSEKILDTVGNEE
jgi:hypothetical protein